jgi:hypothetical protein
MVQVLYREGAQWETMTLPEFSLQSVANKCLFDSETAEGAESIEVSIVSNGTTVVTFTDFDGDTIDFVGRSEDFTVY